MSLTDAEKARRYNPARMLAVHRRLAEDAPPVSKDQRRAELEALAAFDPSKIKRIPSPDSERPTRPAYLFKIVGDATS